MTLACLAPMALNKVSRVFVALVVAAGFALPFDARAEPVKNGFDLGQASIPQGEVMHGGPPRDGIPAIDAPVFEGGEDASWLNDDDRVIGVSLQGVQKAYPIRILNWHEIVNDTFGDVPVLVTFCPLCGTGIVFQPQGQGRVDFGVSGLLYNSDVLLYDRETESLWSQILAEAVSGPRVGERLKVLPSQHTTWGAWRDKHPDTLVLGRETGFLRDYDRDPYAGYEKTPMVFFPVANQVAEDGLHAKERVLGVRIDGVSKAYPYSVLTQLGKVTFKDNVAGKDIVIHWDEEGTVAWATDESGETLPSVDGFWFAWYAFYPDTEVFNS